MRAAADVHAIAQGFQDAFAAQDPIAIARPYDEQAKFLPPNQPPCEGLPAIRAAMQQMVDEGARSLKVEPLEVRQAAELTIEYGRYTLGYDASHGEPATDVGTYVVVHEAQPDGTTKIVLDIFNSNLPVSAARA